MQSNYSITTQSCNWEQRFWNISKSDIPDAKSRAYLDRLVITGCSPESFKRKRENTAIEKRGLVVSTMLFLSELHMRINKTAVQILTSCHWNTITKYWNEGIEAIQSSPSCGLYKPPVSVGVVCMGGTGGIDYPERVAPIVTKSAVYSRGFLFASLSKRQNMSMELRKDSVTVEQSGTVIEKDESAAAKRSVAKRAVTRILPRQFIDTATGEILMVDSLGNYVSWTPQFPSDRPPGSPFRSKSVSEKKPPDSQTRIEKPPQSLPPQQPDTGGPPIPCPPEIKEMMTAFFERMSKFSRRSTLNKFKVAPEKLAKMSNLERLEYLDAPDEHWFKENQARVNKLFEEQINFAPPTPLDLRVLPAPEDNK